VDIPKTKVKIFKAAPQRQDASKTIPTRNRKKNQKCQDKIISISDNHKNNYHENKYPPPLHVNNDILVELNEHCKLFLSLLFNNL
jgi:hypothetical protein